MVSGHFKTALDYIRRSPFKAMAAISVLTLTFLVATLVAVLVYSSSQVLSYFETRPQIIAFLKKDAGEGEINALKIKLEADTRIKQIKYVTKSEALEIYKTATSSNPLLGELVSPDIFPASLEFSVNDLSFAQNIIDEVKSESVVDSMGFTAALGAQGDLQNVVSQLRTVTNYIRIGGGVFVGILSLASFMVILLTIGMRIATRHEEIEILRLIGATNSFIQSPLVMEAIIYAFLGAFLGWVISFTAILYSTPLIVSYFGEIPVLPKDTLDLLVVFGVILGIETLFALFLALSGSLLSISRVKKAR